MPGNTSTSVKRFLLFFIAGMAIIPTIQKGFHPVYSRPLNGYLKPNPLPEFSIDSLFSGVYTFRLTKHYDQGIGFHNDLVRLYNQVDFTLFRIIHARKVVIGKENYLFEESYLTAFNGTDYKGDAIIDARVRQFSEAQQWLKNEKGILFLVLLLPDKGAYYPEKVPPRYARPAGNKTNYETYCSKLKEYGVNHIDFNAWFRSMKDTSRYPLYPKTGIHWSEYGAFLAFDSLVKYLNKIMNYELRIMKEGQPAPSNRLPSPVMERITISDSRGRENDMERACNLLCRIPAPPLAHPQVKFEGTPSRKPFPALFIGDSFYYIWAEEGYIGNVFSNRDFWYYDHSVCYGTYNTGRRAANEDMKQMLARMDAIIIMQTNAGYGELGYYFVDRLFEKGRN